MIYYDLVHNSPEWYRARLGIPTTSKFDKILTPTGKKSAQAKDYRNLLLGELITGQSLETFKQTYWMERGQEYEPEAQKRYAFDNDVEINRGGFFTNDAGTIGASPDLRVFQNGILVGGAEIKCPAPHTHVENLLAEAIDKDYIPQVQGQMLVCELDWIDWFSYHPEMPPSLIRTYRDDAYIATLSDALDDFVDDLREMKEVLIQKGIYFPTIDRPKPAEPDIFDEVLSNDDAEFTIPT